MRILIVCPIFPLPLNNGSSIILFNFIKELSAHNQITLISFVPDNDREFIDEVEKFCKAGYVPFCLKNRQVLIKNIFSFYPYGVQLFKRDEMFKKVHKVINRDNFDFALFYSINSVQYAKEIKDIKKMVFIEDCDSLIYKRRPE